MFRSPLPLPYILLSCWAHLPSPQVLLGLAQYRRADETTVIRNGMVRYATTLLYTVLLLLIVHTFLLTGRFGIDLSHLDSRNIPSWPSQGCIRYIAAPGNHTQLGGISPRSNTPVHARHAMFLTEECVGVALAIY